jgi:hypothetical protein
MHAVDIDVDASEGILQIPWFAIRLFEGNIGGALRVDPGSGRLDDIRYKIRAQASRINAAALIQDRQRMEEETEINATLQFEGRGADPKGNIDLEGSFNITGMGPKFASTVLKALDPKGSDRSIRLTRRLLDAGWKPRLLAFELRHGYVYPSLALSQPWFSPVRIPGILEYGRLPLEFFLQYSMK